MRRGAPSFAPALALALLGSVLAASSARAQVRYIAFGDSITFGAMDDPTRPFAQQGYPGRLDDVLGMHGVNAKVINAGLSGETASEGMTRIEEVLRSTPADAILLMEGTNDLNFHVSAESIAFDLDVMAKKAKNRGVRPIHLTIIPRLPSANTDGDNRGAAELASDLRLLAADEQRDLADPFEVLFWQTPNAFTTLYAGGSDKLHPNAAGYQKLAEIVADALTNTDKVPPVLGSVTPPDGTTNVLAGVTVHVSLLDFGTGIDLSSTRLVINGQEVPALVSGDAKLAKIDFTPSSPFVGAVTVGIRSRDRANPVNTVDRQISRFVIAGTRFLVGDVDENGRVDGADLIPLAIAFGSHRGEPRYVRALDFDDNAAIDGIDLALLAANFGQRSF
ncbi:MAG TPA: GDSL-type esterase/lipase family protein [Thermoanaerobaculia bacterium]|nr:GDSL-type esterase/lipase family protein [Thermoanaerobaculia bacterium]